MRKLLIALALLAAPSAYGACTGSSPTWTTTPDSASVQTCITSATAGDTINISAGSGTWALNSITLAKVLTLNGAGQGVTNISLTGNSSAHITKQTTGVIRIQNLTFIGNNLNVFPHLIHVDGPWPTGQPVIFFNITFTANGGTMIGASTPGGVIISHSAFHGIWDQALITIKDVGTASWLAADTLGTRDTTGFNNIYIEDTTFVGGSNGVTDCDDGCRMVVRHNTFGFGGQDSGGPNSHGDDSSPQGMRHFEIYNNSILFPDHTCTFVPVGQSLSNIGQYIWIRGGTGVIFNNNFDHLSSTCWGTKGEIRMNNRGAEDDRPGGISCAADVYPTTHQLGQNFNGTSLFTDPIWFWGNTGNNGSTAIVVGTGWAWGNPCNFDWNTYWQWGRDGVNTSLALPITLPTGGGPVSALGGTPKPGYTPFAYPHPLVAPSSAPQLNFSPTAVAFGNVTVAAIASQTLTISNVGTATETYSSIALTSSQFTNGNTGLGGQCAASGTILQGASCTVLVKFQPTAVTSYSGTLTMNGTATAAVALTGAGTSSISIPAVPTGLSASVAGSTVNLSWTASTGTPTGYNVLRGATSGSEVTVATLGNVTTYADTGRANGTYFYKVNAFNSAGTSANSSEVSATVSTACSLTLTPSFLTLPNTVLGATSASTNFALTNNGTASCTSVSVATPSGANAADFARTNGCGATITVLGTCNVAVTFSPSIIGVENAAIVITSNDPTSPDTETLQGTGTVAINVSPSSVNFGRVNPNKVSTAHIVTFTNTSGGLVTLSAAIATGDTTQFTKGTDTCTPTVADGASCTVSLTFTPTTAGNKASALVFTYTGAPGSPISVPLSGQSTTHKVRKGVLL